MSNSINKIRSPLLHNHNKLRQSKGFESTRPIDSGYSSHHILSHSRPYQVMITLIRCVIHCRLLLPRSRPVSNCLIFPFLAPSTHYKPPQRLPTSMRPWSGYQQKQATLPTTAQSNNCRNYNMKRKQTARPNRFLSFFLYREIAESHLHHPPFLRARKETAPPTTSTTTVLPSTRRGARRSNQPRSLHIYQCL